MCIADIFFTPVQVNYTLLGEICNLWRNYGDIQDSFADVINIINWWGKNQDVLIPAAGPGRWNDPDMLIGGDFSLSVDEAKLQFGNKNIVSFIVQYTINYYTYLLYEQFYHHVKFSTTFTASIAL